MDEEEKTRILKLYPEFDKIYGPYVRKEDGRRMVVLSKGYTQSSRQLAKVRLEASIGRRLVKGETVDHKDDDYTNDDLNNLQVLTNSLNAAKFHRRGGRFVRKDHDQYCSVCNKPFRSHLERVTCLSDQCKSIASSRISINLGLRPPSKEQLRATKLDNYIRSIFQT